MPASDPSQTASPAAREALRLSLVDNVGPILFGRLVEHFGSVEGVLGASAAELRRVEGIGPRLAEGIARGRGTVDVDAEIAAAAEAGVRIISLDDAEYPAALKHIPDPPICLYVRGTLEPADAVSLAIVGTRRASHYGAEQARRFATLAAQAGMVIVSGLARGIDTAAHVGALEIGGRTLAVIGCGLCHVYPPQNAELARRIAEHGAVISSLPMHVAPESKNFPPRNRIIAGLTLGTLVVEGALRSGAMITARLANEYNREVFALPGRVDQTNSQGPHALIREGQAKLVSCLADILDELGNVGEMLAEDAAGVAPESAGRPAAPGQLSDTEQAVLEVLGVEGMPIEAVCEFSGRGAAEVAGALTMLQLKGLVRRLPEGLFVSHERA